MADIKVSKEEYERLLIADLKLSMLEAAGVDNWMWYGEALYPDEGPNFQDECDIIEQEVNQKEEV